MTTQTILVSEMDNTIALAYRPKVGDLVENFGQIARVVEVRPAPYNDLIVRDVQSGQKWAANPAKCKPVR